MREEDLSWEDRGRDRLAHKPEVESMRCIGTGQTGDIRAVGQTGAFCKGIQARRNLCAQTSENIALGRDQG
jgi:hypothetical protein